MGKTVTAYGNAQIDTAQSKFGGASGLFDGTGDRLSTPDSDDWYFGTGDFTIDFWVRFNFLNTIDYKWHVIFSQLGGITNSQYFGVTYYGGVWRWVYRVWSGSIQIINIEKATTLVINTWYHIALVRSGNSWYIFQDGTQLATTATDEDSVPNFTTSVCLGYLDSGSGSYFDGWLDELRVSKGITRWTSNFTPPTVPYTTDEYTKLLLHCDGTDGGQTFLDSSGDWYKSLSATEVSSAVLAKVATFYRSLNVTEISSVTLSKIVTFLKALAATVTSLADLIAQKIEGGIYYVVLEGMAVTSATLNIVSTFARLLSVVESSVTSLSKKLFQSLSVVEVSVATLEKALMFWITLAASMVGVASLQKSITRVVSLVAGAISSATIGKTISKTLSVIESSASTLAKTATRFMSLTATAISSVSLSRIATFLKSLSIVATSIPSLDKVATFFRTLTVAAVSKASLTLQAGAILFRGALKLLRRPATLKVLRRPSTLALLKRPSKLELEGDEKNE